MVEGHWTAELVHAAQDFRERLLQIVEKCHLVEQALAAAFGGSAIVALDIDDQRVVELAHLVDGVDDAAHLVVAMRERRRIDLHHMGEHLLLVGVERIPRLDAFRARGELRVLGDDAHRLLLGERHLALLVPALIELALEFLDPLLWRVMRRMRGARRVIGEERLVRRHGVLHAQPVDRLVRHVAIEIVVGIVMRRLDRPRVLDERRRPLIAVAADEAVEIFEAEADRPQVERTGLARLPVGHVVVLAEPRRVVAVELENIAETALRLRHQRVVAGIPHPRLHDDAGGGAVVIASGEQRRPRRRAQRRGMEIVEPEAGIGDPLHGRRRNRPAEGAGGAEADVVGQDQEDIRRAFGCGHLLRKILHRVRRRKTDLAFERRIRLRQDVPGCFLGQRRREGKKKRRGGGNRNQYRSHRRGLPFSKPVTKSGRRAGPRSHRRRARRNLLNVRRLLSLGRTCKINFAKCAPIACRSGASTAISPALPSVRRP